MIMIVGPSEYGYVFWFHGSLFATEGILQSWPNSLKTTHAGATYLTSEVSEHFYSIIDTSMDKVEIPGTDLYSFGGPQRFCIAPLSLEDVRGSKRRRLKTLVRNGQVPDLLRDLAWTRICRRLVLHGAPKIQRNIEAECRALSRELGVQHRRLSTIRNAANQLRATVAAGDILAPTWRVSSSRSWHRIHVQLTRQLSIQDAHLRSRSLRPHLRDSYDAVHMARDDIDAVLSNLVSNAIKYAQHGGALSIQSDRTVQGGLSVRFSGISVGIAESEVPMLTRLGHRGTAAMAVVKSQPEDGESTGLGLGIAARVIAAYGGSLDIEPGQIRPDGYGENTFVVTFPSRMVQ